MSIEITVRGTSEDKIAEALELNGLYTQQVGTTPSGAKFLMITTEHDGGYTVGSVTPGYNAFSGSILTLDTGRLPSMTLGGIMAYLAQVG